MVRNNRVGMLEATVRWALPLSLLALAGGLALLGCAVDNRAGVLDLSAPTATARAGAPGEQSPAVRIVGTVTAVSLSAGVIVLTSAEGNVDTINVPPATLIRDVQDKSIDLEAITPGMRIEATGSKGQGSTMLAETVTILGSAGEKKPSPTPPLAAMPPASTPRPSTPTALPIALPSVEELQRLLPADGKLLHHAVADLDGDGKQEAIALAAFGLSPDGLSAKRLELFVFRPGLSGYALGWRSGLLMTGERAGPLQVQDINRDGRPEILSTQSFGAAGETLYVLGWLGNRYGAFQPQGGHFDAWGSFGATGVGVVDLNGDGIAEISASYGPASSQTDVYRWDGQGYRYVSNLQGLPTVTAAQPLTLRVYFTRIEANEVKLVPVTRTLPRTEAMGRTAILELLKGPSEEEKRSGLQTAIPAGAELKNLRIQDGTAYADFNKALEDGVGGSLQAAAIRRQITLTLQQFSTVQQVIIAVDGRTEDILQP